MVTPANDTMSTEDMAVTTDKKTETEVLANVGTVFALHGCEKVMEMTKITPETSVRIILSNATSSTSCTRVSTRVNGQVRIEKKERCVLENSVTATVESDSNVIGQAITRPTSCRDKARDCLKLVRDSAEGTRASVDHAECATSTSQVIRCCERTKRSQASRIVTKHSAIDDEANELHLSGQKPTLRKLNALSDIDERLKNCHKRMSGIENECTVWVSCRWRGTSANRERRRHTTPDAS